MVKVEWPNLWFQPINLWSVWSMESRRMDGFDIEDTHNYDVSGKVSDGSTACYYELPVGATQLQDLISAKNMNAQIGEIFRACYRLGEVSHSPPLRDAKKILFYAQAEIDRLEGVTNE